MLAWFRRHAKILMVVLGSAAMAIFGLGPVFDTLASRGGGSDPRETEVIATWKGGDITRASLDLMEMRHYQAQRFLGGVQQAAEKKKGDVVNSLAIPIAPIRDGRREMIDDQLITRYLMAERALQEGMIVSDGMVNDYIALLSGDAGFSQRNLEEINDTVNNRYCSLSAVRERLKAELLANQMQLCCMTAVPLVPNPMESMEFYGRTMEQIECEVLPIEVAKYVGKVSEKPTAAELKSLYEEGKYEFPDPTGERPGFKIGRKLNLQYLIADYDTYLLNEMNKLSDEDVQKEYDRLVEEKNELVLEPLPVDDGSIQINDPPPTNPDVEPPKSSDDEAGDVAAPPASTTDDVAPPPAAEGKQEAQQEKEKPDSVDGKTEEESTSGDKSKTEGEDGSKKEDKSKGDGDQSINVRSTKSQFVSTSIQENKQEENKQEENKQEENKQEKVADDSNKSDSAETASSTSPTGEAPADQDAEKTEASKSAQSETAEGVDPKASDAKPQNTAPGGLDAIIDAATDQAKDEEPVVRTPKPLKDVVEDVKRSMCQEAANKAMNDALTKASVIVQDHFEKRMRWEYDNQNDKIEEPAPLNHQELAKKYNLIAKETGLVDDLEIASDQIGQVRVFMNMMVQGRQTPQLVPVGQLVFNDFSELRLYDTETVNDNWGTKSSYLFWASKKAETRIPPLEEAEAQVEKFWVTQKALELAMTEAESIKQKVSAQPGKKLSELYSEQVAQTGAFTWFSNFGSSRYSTPIGVNRVGEKFMQTAFGLKSLETGVAANEPKDTVYVIQAQSEPKSVEAVGVEYLEDQFFKFKRIPNEVQRVAQLYYQEFNLNWNQEFQDTMGLKFMDR